MQAHLKYTESGPPYSWTDVLVLDRAGSEWVVSDIRFSRGGTLVANMREGLAEIERELSPGSN